MKTIRTINTRINLVTKEKHFEELFKKKIISE
jgi:hypothetical protein